MCDAAEIFSDLGTATEPVLCTSYVHVNGSRLEMIIYVCVISYAGL
jgi:hypothetical protein